MRLYSSNVLSFETPLSLQRKVFFELMLYYCRRDSENLREVTPNDFVIQERNGVECMLKFSDEMTKNHWENQENQDEGLMIATGTPQCPVAAYKLNIQKLNPKCRWFFKGPKAKAPPTGTWFDNMVFCVKTLKKMMRRISADAVLMSCVLTIALGLLVLQSSIRTAPKTAIYCPSQDNHSRCLYEVTQRFRR